MIIPHNVSFSDKCSAQSAQHHTGNRVPVNLSENSKIIVSGLRLGFWPWQVSDHSVAPAIDKEY